MKRLIFLLAALGLSFFAYGAYIPAKAVLAQYLINDAWNDSIRSGESHKPWRWADMHPVMKLSSVKHNQDLIVLSGDKGNSLAFAPGYNINSYMPHQGGTTVISAHRDTHFEFLQNDKRVDMVNVPNTYTDDPLIQKSKENFLKNIKLFFYEQDLSYEDRNKTENMDTFLKQIFPKIKDLTH